MRGSCRTRRFSPIKLRIAVAVITILAATLFSVPVRAQRRKAIGERSQQPTTAASVYGGSASRQFSGAVARRTATVAVPSFITRSGAMWVRKHREPLSSTSPSVGSAAKGTPATGSDSHNTGQVIQSWINTIVAVGGLFIAYRTYQDKRDRGRRRLRRRAVAPARSPAPPGWTEAPLIGTYQAAGAFPEGTGCKGGGVRRAHLKPRRTRRRRARAGRRR